MLIITRNLGEAIMIGDDICVRIGESKSNEDKSMWIGIDAPINIHMIHWEHLHSGNKDSSTGVSSKP